MIHANLRHARRQGALAAIDHLLRGEEMPDNPYKPKTKSFEWFKVGADQARRFAEPLRELKP